jgi:hypothetical protein
MQKSPRGPYQGGRGRKTFGGRRTKAMEVSLFLKNFPRELGSTARVGKAKQFSNDFPKRQFFHLRHPYNGVEMESSVKDALFSENYKPL